MEYTYFPVTPEAFGAQVRYNNLGEGVFVIDDVTIRTRYLNHPALTLAFRIEADGAAIIYSCDHEPHSKELAEGSGEIAGEDLAHAEFMTGADLVIHDAQYLAVEYAAKRGWGHSTVEYAIAISAAARAKRLALTHHDPMRTDDQIDAVLDRLRLTAKPGWPDIFAAAEGMEIEIGSAMPGAGLPVDSNVASALREGPASETALVLVLATDNAVADKIERAVATEPVAFVRTYDIEAALDAVARRRPALVLAQDDTEGLERLATALGGRKDDTVPLILLGGEGPEQAGAVDRLDEPWSMEYARTRIRTWLMRAECHWTRAPIPRDEALRLAALRALAIMDTPAEERFDRHTRLAASLFKVPVALVSLVDADRQWFKSCHGTDVCETSRETSFCAHAVAARTMLVVPDTLADTRFRDNPLVADEPHVRFYAGAPIHSADGQPLGTLCILDMRPRNLSDHEKGLLADLAAMVEAEMTRPHPARPR